MGKVFADRYRATGEVFSGGGGRVYVCDDPNLDRKVVIKFLRPGVERRRLQDEVAALQRIVSKNVVQVLDIVEHDTLGTGIVSEFLPGDDLDQADAPRDRLNVLRLIYQLANGIADIHAAGVVHRDLKPNNVKYGEEGVLKIIDFNLARTSAPSSTDGFKGTYGFAAPEQYGSGKMVFTKMVDMYSFAATVACIINNKSLPSGLDSDPPNPSLWKGGFKSLPHIDPEIAEILNRCISVAPESRPAAIEVRNLARDHICFNRHKATLTIRGNDTVYHLDSSHRSASVSHGSGGGGITIKYNGHGFAVGSVSGSVLANRQPCKVGENLPHSCVIDLGSASGRERDRLFVTFDLSHPEVVQ